MITERIGRFAVLLGTSGFLIALWYWPLITALAVVGLALTCMVGLALLWAWVGVL